MWFRFMVLVSLIASYAQANEKKVTVVGAGLAGLTAAYRIEKLTGHPVDVYEARSRPGGRVYTVRFGSPMGGSYEELGGKSVTDGGDAIHILALIAEMRLETESYDMDLTNRKFAYKGKVDWYNAALLNGPKPTQENYALASLWAKEAKNLGEVLDRLFEGHDVLRHLAELRMRGYEGNDSQDLSVAYLDSFWETYAKNYELAKTKKASTYTMANVKGGNSLLVEKIANAIHGKVHYNSPLRKISKTEKGAILLQFEEGIEVLTDYLILAIPCSTLRDVEIEEGILPGDQRQAIATLQYGSNSKILLPVTLDQETISGFAYTENMVTWFNNDRSVVTFYYGGKPGLFDSKCVREVSKKIAEEIAPVKMLYPSMAFPFGVEPARLEDSLSHYAQPVGICWMNEEFSKGSYSSWGIDQFASFDATEDHLGETVRTVFRPIDNSIFFAGEHAALEYPATMEGAVESGERTARMVSRIFGSSQPSLRTE